jgi:NTE family protein
VVVDGGLLSNFPISLFLADRDDVAAVVGPPEHKNVLGLLIDETLPVPNRPPKAASGTSAGFTSLRTFQRLSRLINTATGASDNMAIAAFARHVVHLPAGGYGTTQFDMTDDERNALVDAGRQAMRAFLAGQTVLEGTREIGGGDFAPSAESTWMANDAAGTILQR